MPRQDLVSRANVLLHAVGKDGFVSLDELKRSACSMFVFLLEQLFNIYLEGVIRRPALPTDYARNADLVLQALSDVNGDDLGDISGAEIANGNIAHISALLEEFEHIMVSEERGNTAFSLDDETDSFIPGDEGVSEHSEGMNPAMHEPLYEDESSYYMEEPYLEEGDDLYNEAFGSVYENDGYSQGEWHPELYEDYEGYPFSNERYVGDEDFTDASGSETMERVSVTGRFRLPRMPRKNPNEISISSADGASEDGYLLPRPLRSRFRNELPVRQNIEIDTLSSFSSSINGEVDYDENPLEDMIDRFPQQSIARSRQLEAIRSLALHRTENINRNEYSVKHAREREHDKGRFRKAYQAILNDERREARLREERRRLIEKLEDKRRQYESRLERTKIKKLSEDLEREARGRRQRRKAKEDALVKSMFDDALATEKERVLRSTAIASEERAKLDAAALRRYEAARKLYEDKKDMLDERTKKQLSLEHTQQRNREEHLRRLSRELKENFEKKLRDSRIALDAHEERVYEVNSNVIERAFAILNDHRAALYHATNASLAA